MAVLSARAVLMYPKFFELNWSVSTRIKDIAEERSAVRVLLVLSWAPEKHRKSTQGLLTESSALINTEANAIPAFHDADRTDLKGHQLCT